MKFGLRTSDRVPFRFCRKCYDAGEAAPYAACVCDIDSFLLEPAIASGIHLSFSKEQHDVVLLQDGRFGILEKHASQACDAESVTQKNRLTAR